MSLDEWHKRAIENDELIQWLRREMETALAAQHELFSEIVETTGVTDGGGEATPQA